jgi:hypothetical protein
MDRIEQIATVLHDAWWEYQIKVNKKTLSPYRSDTTHPHLVPFSALDVEAQNQDRFQAAIHLKKWMDTGTEITAKDIHDAWRLWQHVHADYRHIHDKEYDVVHGPPPGKGPQEHQLQADKVNELLRKWRHDVYREHG